MKLSGSLFVFLFCLAFGLCTESPVVKLNAGDVTSSDSFGVDVALWGSYVIVGASKHDAFGVANSGAVYIFYQNQNGANVWGLQKKLTTPGGVQAGDNFGASVWMSDGYLIVGAPGKQTQVGLAIGAAYIYEISPEWKLVANLTGSGTTFSYFGTDVSLSGTCAVVGEPGTVTQMAYIFCRVGSVWTLKRALTGSSDKFGGVVTINGDFVAVGASYTSAVGTVRVYYRLQGGADNWGQTQQLTSGQLFDFFGNSIAFNKDQLAVGANMGDVGYGVVYMYWFNTSDYRFYPSRTLQANKYTDIHTYASYFGFALSFVGDLLVVTSLGDDRAGIGNDAGALEVFARNSNGTEGWGRVATVEPTDRVLNNRFGMSIASDVHYMVVGSTTGVYVMTATCLAGYMINSVTGGCESCQFGTYSTAQNVTSCYSCPPATSTVSRSSTSVSQCLGGNITSLSTPVGPTYGGSIITIFGSNLGNESDITSVTLAGISATILSQNRSYVVVQSTQSIAGIGDVRIYSRSFGTIVGQNAFTYNNPPRVLTPPPSVLVEFWSVWRYTLPAGTFYDDDDAILYTSASLANGASLPDWLYFNKSDNTLTGVPSTWGYMPVYINATDTHAVAIATIPVTVNPGFIYGMFILAISASLLSGFVAWKFLTGFGTYHIADVYVAKNFDEAEKVTLEALDWRMKELSPQHPAVLAARHDLACIYRHQGRLAEAEKILNDLLGIQVKTHGLMHGSVSALVHTLARVYRNQGRNSEAENLVSRAGIRGYFTRPVNMPAGGKGAPSSDDSTLKTPEKKPALSTSGVGDEFRTPVKLEDDRLFTPASVKMTLNSVRSNISARSGKGSSSVAPDLPSLPVPVPSTTQRRVISPVIIKALMKHEGRKAGHGMSISDE